MTVILAITTWRKKNPFSSNWWSTLGVTVGSKSACCLMCYLFDSQNIKPTIKIWYLLEMNDDWKLKYLGFWHYSLKYITNFLYKKVRNRQLQSSWFFENIKKIHDWYLEVSIMAFVWIFYFVCNIFLETYQITMHIHLELSRCIIS